MDQNSPPQWPIPKAEKQRLGLAARPSKWWLLAGVFPYLLLQGGQSRGFGFGCLGIWILLVVAAMAGGQTANVATKSSKTTPAVVVAESPTPVATPTPTPTATSAPTPAPTPMPTVAPTPVPTAAYVPPPAPTSSGCYIDPEGNCYRAGEYCPTSMHGQTIQGANGPLTCTYNNGWRWENA